MDGIIKPVAGLNRRYGKECLTDGVKVQKEKKSFKALPENIPGHTVKRLTGMLNSDVANLRFQNYGSKNIC